MYLGDESYIYHVSWVPLKRMWSTTATIAYKIYYINASRTTRVRLSDVRIYCNTDNFLLKSLTVTSYFTTILHSTQDRNVTETTESSFPCKVYEKDFTKYTNRSLAMIAIKLVAFLIFLIVSHFSDIMSAKL